MSIKENLHKILLMGGTLFAFNISNGTQKEKHDIPSTVLHPNDPYCAKAIRFSEQEKITIQPLICFKNGSAKQFVTLIIKGIAKNKDSDYPTKVCDLIVGAEKLLLPVAKRYAQEYPNNLMFQENLKDLKTIIKLYKKAYERTAFEDALQKLSHNTKNIYARGSEQRA